MTSVLELPDYDLMDCVAANVAVLVSLEGRDDPRRTLGSQWHFAFDAGDDRGTPILDRLSLEEQLRLLAGIELRRHRLADPLDALAELLEASDAVLVYGDAYEMPWLPLHRMVHLEHTFVITALDRRAGTATVLDAYTNRTEHGDARPTATVADLATVLAGSVGPSGAVQALTLHRQDAAGTRATPGEIVLGNCRALVEQIAHHDPIAAFAAHHERDGDPLQQAAALALDCWLVARKRALHRRWLGLADGEISLPAGFEERFAERVVTPWQRAATFAHLAERRARDGRRASGGVLRLVDGDLRDAERTLAEELLGHLEAGG